MAKLYISEYETPNRKASGSLLPLAKEPAHVTKAITFTTAVQSQEFHPNTSVIRMFSDTACNIAFGSDPTADANSPRHAANVEYWREIVPGQKLSVYDGSS